MITPARIAAAGLGLAVVALGGFALWSAGQTADSAEELARDRELSSAYDQLRGAVDGQSLLEYEAGVGHGQGFSGVRDADVARQWQAADERVRIAIGNLKRAGAPADREFASSLGEVQSRYRRTIVALTRPPGGDRAADLERRAARLQRELQTYQDRLQRIDPRENAGSVDLLESLEDKANRLRLGALIAFGLAVGMMIALALFLRGYQRRAEDARLAKLRQLEAAALTDDLTGVRNHRAFDEDLIRELQRQTREGGDLALVMLDLDGLKGVNDRYGHQQGDEQLRALAASAIEAMRGSDACYRLGGDEFALILPGADEDGALGVCERLGEQLGAASEIPASATAGIACTGGELAKEELIRRADRALYDAKAGGRRIAVYSEHADGRRPVRADG